jgi:serine/threonine protein kinase
VLAPGDLIDVWVVEKAIGSGGMGSVYRCHNRHAARILAAIKTLEGAVRRVPEAEQRFVREAEILFALDHPSVVKVRNVRLDLETPYLEMEFIEGESLESRLCRGPVPLDSALQLMSELVDALAYLHDHGVRHRDIKPANLLIDKSGRLKLVDFGLASEADVERITRANTTFGTVSYAPPEWVRPEELDPESWDVYSAGVVFWEMLTARVAFPGSANIDPRQVAIHIMTRKQGHAPLDPGPSYLDDLRALCRDMTQSDKALRIPSARAAQARLQRLEQRLSTGALDIPSDMPGATRARTPAADLGLDQPTYVAFRKDPHAATPLKAPDEAPPIKRKPTAPPPDVELAPPPVRRKTTRPDPDPVLDAPPRPPPPSTSSFMAGAAVLAVAAFVAIAGGVPVLVWALGLGPFAPPSARDVDVVVVGLSHGTDAGLSLGGQAPVGSDGFVFHFPKSGLGPATVAWAAGADCVAPACPGAACPGWCAHGESPATVVDGPGVQQVTIEVQPPSPRPVTIRAPALGLDWKLVGQLSDLVGLADKNEVAFESVVPGAYLLTLTAGECAPDQLGCDNAGTCPPGCASWKGEVVVPAAAGAFAWDAPLRPPVPKPDVPKPPVDPVAPRASHAVTNAEFARWLAKNPDWSRDAAIAAGTGDPNYLRDWTNGQPPGAGSAFAGGVSWAAAQAYCRSHGGLASVDADPREWAESPSQPFMEWRISGSSPAWRRADGAPSTKVEPAQSNGFTGFRCAR